MLNKIRQKFINREFWIFSSIYFFLSFINLRVKLFLTPAWFNGTLISNHEHLIRFNYFNHEQSRLLQFYIPESFHKLFSLSIEHAYILQRWLFIFLAFICFHKFLRKWFNIPGSFSGVLFLAAIMPLSYFNHLQESSPLLLLTFLLGLWTIRENKIFYLIIVLIIGGLNNETILILLSVYFFYNYKSSKIREILILCRNTFLISLPSLFTIGLIRFITRNQPVFGGAWHFPVNIIGIINNLSYNVFDSYRAFFLYIFLIFNIFWIYTFIRYKDKPLFLKRASLMIPLFVVAHLITGIISEVRQMLPLSFIIIPMTLFYIFPSKSPKEKIGFLDSGDNSYQKER